jgi:type VI secretion system secreted protein Hcp
MEMKGFAVGAYLMLSTSGSSPTIQGSSTESTHTNWIPIESWNVSSTRPVVTQGGHEETRHRGEAEVGELTFAKVVDKSSVYLLQNLLEGTSIANMQLDMTTQESGTSVVIYFTIKGTNVRITNHSFSGSGAEGSVALENFSLNATSLTWTYTYYDPENGSPTPSTVSFNLDTVVSGT